MFNNDSNRKPIYISVSEWNDIAYAVVDSWSRVEHNARNPDSIEAATGIDVHDGRFAAMHGFMETMMLLGVRPFDDATIMPRRAAEDDDLF